MSIPAEDAPDLFTCRLCDRHIIGKPSLSLWDGVDRMWVCDVCAKSIKREPNPFYSYFEGGSPSS